MWNHRNPTPRSGVLSTKHAPNRPKCGHDGAFWLVYRSSSLIRYAGQALPPSPRIALISNDAIGNFVVGTPLMQMLRAAHQPSCLDYFGGSRTRELSDSSSLLDGVFDLHGTEPRAMVAKMTDQPAYDLVINLEQSATALSAAAVLAGEMGNVCGPCVGKAGRGSLDFPLDPQGDLWRDKHWIAEDIRERYPFLNSSFIGEMFCRLAYLEGAVPRYLLPTIKPQNPVPDILIATGASLPEKRWTEEAWTEALSELKRSGNTIGLLGAPPALQREFWNEDDLETRLVHSGLVEDLRGTLTLPGVVGAIERAKLVLTIDNGILHLACGTETPVVGLFRHGIHRLWLPPVPNVHPITPGEERVVAEISPKDVLELCYRVLA